MNEQIKIGSIIKQIRGVSYKPTDVREADEKNAVALLRANNIQETGLNFDDLVYIDRSMVKSEQYLRAGDILICSSSGSKNLVGKAAYVPDDLPCSFGAFCKVVRTQAVDSYYLGQYFQSPRYRQEISEASAGANINNIRNEHIDELTIPAHSKSEQMEIVQILLCLNEQIDCTKQQLEKLDELVKSRFVEMFGDPISHLDRGETKQLDRIAERITVGFVGEASNDYVEAGVPYLRTQNVRVNHIDLEGLIYVNESFHKKNSKSIIRPGDIVISRVGANRGMAAVIPESLPEANIANCLIVGRTNLIDSCYLAFYLNMSYGKRPQFGASVGSAQGVVNTSVLKKWEIYVPEKKEQKEFVEYVNQVDKSKLAVQQSLEKLETLKKSLMQQYFG